MVEFNSLSKFFDDFIEKKDGYLENFYFDLHMHTPASDGNISGEFLKEFLKDKEYLISVTDHNSIEGNIALRKLGINVVPGLELGCEDGFEILVYFKKEEDMIDFYNKEVLPFRNRYRMAKTRRSVFEYVKILRENYEVYISIPHINGYAQKNYLKNKDYIDEILKMVDGIEIYNHSLSKGKNQVARNIRKNYGIGGTFGSDAHEEREILSFWRFLNREERGMKKTIDTICKIKTVSGIGKKHLLYLIKHKGDK